MPDLTHLAWEGVLVWIAAYKPPMECARSCIPQQNFSEERGKGSGSESVGEDREEKRLKTTYGANRKGKN